MANPRLAGYFASGAVLLVVTWVAASAITMGPHNDTPQSLPFSCSQAQRPQYAAARVDPLRHGGMGATAIPPPTANRSSATRRDHVMPP
jgi:hypothetical protein